MTPSTSQTRSLPKLIASTLIASLMSVMGCSSVEIPEQALFNHHRSLLPRDFPLKGFALEEVTVTAQDGVELDGWHMYRPPGEGDADQPRAALIYFGGQGFHLVLSAKIFESLLPLIPPNTDVYAFDYRGYGKSGGEPDVQTLQEDAARIWEYVTGRADVDISRMLLHGQSMGSFLAAEVAAQTGGAAGVVLEAPITTAEDWIDTVVPGWLQLFLRLEPSPGLAEPDNLANVTEFEAPLLLAAGSEDKVAPPELAKRLHKAAASPKKEVVIVEGGDHNNLPTFGAFTEAYRAHLVSALE